MIVNVSDIGPDAGKNGGEVVYSASVKEFADKDTITSEFLI